MKVARAAGSLTFALLLTAGCANRHPKTATLVEPPQPLAVPAPPPRVILPPQPEAQEPVEEPQPTNASRPRPRNQGRPAEPPKTDTPKAEATPQTPPAPAPETQQPAPEKPAQDLQPADAAGEAAIRVQIGRARQDLKRVNYAGLSADMKSQYDQAKRFLDLSEQNLKEHNRLLASTLADKAGAIAEMLTRR